jgi:NADH:ubiquinone oxidoreductase subunit K
MLELVPFFLVFTGISCIFVGRKNLILIIIGLELLLLGLLFHYVFIGWYIFGDFKMIYLGIVLLTVGAAESAIGLALLIAYYKIYR